MRSLCHGITITTKQRLKIIYSYEQYIFPGQLRFINNSLCIHYKRQTSTCQSGNCN